MPLYVKIIIGLALGIVWSFLSSMLGWNQFTIDWIDPFGTIFIRLLKFIAVPLVLFSIITGVAGMNDIGRLGKLGGKTLLIYLLTTVFAVTVGLLIGNVFEPGSHIDKDQLLKNRISYEKWAIESGVEILDGKSYLSDPNYADITLEDHIDLKKAQEAIDVDQKIALMNKNREQGPLRFLVDMVPENIIFSISNNKLMLQVIFFAIFFGITLIMIPAEKAAPLIEFFTAINEAFLKWLTL